MLVDYWRFALSNSRFLGFGFFLAFMSSAGQTYFIGVFGAGIQADFGLDAGSWGRTYMIGTLASALVINWTGALIDRLDLRLFTALALLRFELCLPADGFGYFTVNAGVGDIHAAAVRPGAE